MLSHLRPQGMVRVLLLTDQPPLSKAMSSALNRHALMVKTETDSADVPLALREWSPHIVVWDLDMQGSAGIENILSPARQGGRQVPVIALTRSNDLNTKLHALYEVADDLMTFPFAMEELLARILVVMRRSYRSKPVIAPIIHVKDLEIDIANRRVRVDGKEVHLTPLEISILYLLAANAGNALSRQQITEQLWGPEYLAKSNLVDRHIRNLREKLNTGLGAPPYIFTVPGVGYRIAPAERRRRLASG